MYWLRRPPYLRWIAAGFVLAAGLFLDTRPAAVTSHPFVAEYVSVGERVDEYVEWRTVPHNVLEKWQGDATGIATADIPAGTPLLPSLVSDVATPSGWWAVPLELAYPVAPGTPIRVGLEDRVVEGITVGATDSSGYSLNAPVAFPADDAADVARMATNALVVMVGPQETAARPGG